MTIPLPPDTIVPGQGIFRVLYGSWAHGTNTPTSDTDWRGVFLLPNDDFLGLDVPRTTFEVKATDEVYWELGHFCRLLLKGNPNIVGMLFAPDDVISDVHPAFLPLLDHRGRFLHSVTVQAYLGWIHRELRDIAKLHKGNAKRLSHIPRLIWEIEGVVRERTLVVRPSQDRRDYITAIKMGERDYQEAVAEVGSMLLDLDDLVNGETFPDPPRDWLQKYLLDTREAYGR